MQLPDYRRNRKIEKFAVLTRARLAGSEDGPFAALSLDLGVKLEEGEFSNESLHHFDLTKRVVMLNTNVGGPRKAKGDRSIDASFRENLLQRFAITHGLAHIMLEHNISQEFAFPIASEDTKPFSWDKGDQIAYRAPHADMSSIEEWEADQFAADFLAPRVELLNIIRHTGFEALGYAYHVAENEKDAAQQVAVTRNILTWACLPNEEMFKIAHKILPTKPNSLLVAAEHFGVPSSVIQHQLVRPPYPDHSLMAITHS